MSENVNLLPVRPVADSYWVIPEHFLAGEYPGSYFSTDLTRRCLNVFIQSGFTTMIDLTAEDEVGRYEGILHEQAEHYGVAVFYRRFPIVDFGLPSRELMLNILDAIDIALVNGQKIYLHCHGGVGRTGTTVGCFLVRHGSSGSDALLQLADWWANVPKSTRHPHSPETAMQRKFILDWVG